MSTVVLCPDDSVARARAAALAPGERQAIAAHLEACGACRTALAVAGAFEREPAVLAGDDRLLARLAARTGTPARGHAERGHARPRRRLAIAGAVVALLGGSAAAAFWSMQAGTRPAASARLASNAPARAVAPALVSPAPPPPLRSPLPVEAPAPVRTAPRAAAREAPGALLRQAREARAGGDWKAAVAFYQRLQRQYPASAEATIAQVSLGTLLLESGDAVQARTAVAAFERYLAAAPDGPLREEALNGRARAFAAISDAVGERAAWQALIDAYPRSIHAPAARRRIEELDRTRARP